MSVSQRMSYAEWLSGRMRERGVSQRQLGARLTPESPEIGRRSVRRYLKGTVPIERNRRAIAGALGTGNDLGPEDDSEEDRELMDDLMARIEELHSLARRVKDAA